MNLLSAVRSSFLVWAGIDVRTFSRQDLSDLCLLGYDKEMGGYLNIYSNGQ
jgi:hypothetical protein